MGLSPVATHTSRSSRDAPPLSPVGETTSPFGGGNQTCQPRSCEISVPFVVDLKWRRRETLLSPTRLDRDGDLASGVARTDVGHCFGGFAQAECLTDGGYDLSVFDEFGEVEEVLLADR